ncbi:hypothetical protein [Gilliamella sp. BG6]|uniref:hypothetical protein n=1 Tax=unclassified Gilliamella TaxID=2685620 RepID=UPI0039873DEA
MPEVNNQAIETIYGEIYGRDALILKDIIFDMFPLELKVVASLWLPHCQPSRGLEGEALICFKFKNIKSLTITMIEESKYQLVQKSCFDKVFDKEQDEHYVLSTYDHIFDVIGQCEVSYK